MNRQRPWLWLAVSTHLLTALISACKDAGITGPLAPQKASQSVEVLPVRTFNGYYTNTFELPGGYVHVDRATVAATTVRGAHTFSNGVQSGYWFYTATITVDPFDPNHGTLSGSGTRSDRCCGSIEFTVTGDIFRNADGSAALFYSAIDPRFGPFGSAAYRRAIPGLD